MIPRYTLPEMGAIWSEATRFRLFVEVEVAVVRARARRLPGWSPWTVADPPVGLTSPASSRRVVVLPAPLGPRNPWTSPVRTVMSSPSSARVRP